MQRGNLSHDCRGVFFMFVYIVYDRRHDLFEVYLEAPHWNEEYQMWLGRDYLTTISNKELKEEHAKALRMEIKPRKFYVSLNVIFEEEEG